MALPSAFALCLALATASGCARGPDVSSPELPLRRVVIYRNGVGYFERGGSVESEEVSFKMRQRMVGDFLATLAIVERGGSSLKAASFPIELEEEDPIGDDPRFTRLLDAWQNPSVAPRPRPKSSERLRRVRLSLDGREHQLQVGYVAATPLWRPSYRVVVGERDASLQVWGIVQNLSGEDWKNVSLTLVAGAPIAFESTLGDPVTPARPVVTDTGEVISEVPEGMTSLDDKAEADEEAQDHAYSGDAPATEPTSAQPPGDGKVTRLKGVAGGASRRAEAPATRAAAAPPPPPSAPPSPKRAQAESARQSVMEELAAQGLSAPRQVAALAAVAVQSGATRYQIPGQVTVPDESATMVLLVSRKVPGESVFMFAPDPGVTDSAGHPFRVVRFENATQGLLERGPIAVFGKGQFLGQGMLDALPARGKATVPFALDRSVAVTSERLMTEQGARLFRIEAGALMIERDSVLKTTYKISSGSGEASKLIVRHARQHGARLHKPPANTEDNLATQQALVSVAIPARGKTELVVDERRAVQQSLDWLHPLADEAVKAYMADSRADREIARKLGDAWSLRETLKKATEQQQALVSEQAELEKSSRETRLSLEAIEKNTQAADLRARLTRRLAEIGSRLEQITKQLIELRLKLGEAQVRFNEAVREIKLTAPLPPRD
jgi:hypothetical protein